jgi:integrase
MTSESTSITFRAAGLRYTVCAKALLYPGDERRFRRAEECLGPIPLREITNPALAAAAAAIHGDAGSSTAIREFWRTIKRFIKWCINEGLCEPWQILVPRPPKSPPPRILSVEEEARLIAELPDHVRPFVMFLLSTGCLIEEARLLEWSQVKLDRGFVRFPRMGEHRETPLDKDVIAELRWLQLTNRDGVVFRKLNREPYVAKRISCVDKSAFNRACIRAGLRGVTQKSLQYTWVVRELAKGRSIRELQKVGGSDGRMIARINRDCQFEIDSYRQWLGKHSHVP